MKRVLAYLIVFVAALVLTLVLTPLVREFNRRHGLVDKPDPRRINKVPIPRGGGVALVLGVFASYFAYHFWTGRPALQGISDAQFYKLAALACGVSALGLADDRFGLRPIVKLLGQIAFAFGVWFWAGLGFADLWPALPPLADCALTMFWLVGAMNAFNLIDGLDGLAAGLAFIATVGMGGSVFVAYNPQSALFYAAFAGGLLGFLRYNYNPASVFLGDSGSMFIGFVLAALPLCSHVPHSFLVSVGIPLLAMGVPIFDTSLAIVRRTTRRLLHAERGETGGSGQVMTADLDHLHHRILRASGLSQRKAACTLYALAAIAVGTGLVGLWVESRAASLWIVAMGLAAYVIVRDMKRVELYDMGLLMNDLAHRQTRGARRLISRITTPFYVIADGMILIATYFLCMSALREDYSFTMMRVSAPIRVFAIFLALCGMRTYRTAWSRATTYNYFRLFLACGIGALLGAVGVSLAGVADTDDMTVFPFLYGAFSFLFLMGLRQVRGLVRDAFYRLDCARLKTRKDVSRVLVYGAGLRFKAFMRELVRSTTANDCVVVGLLDDDPLLSQRDVGDARVLGTLHDAPRVIVEQNADTVVIVCEMTDEWMKVVRDTLAPTGVRILQFSFTGAPKEFFKHDSQEEEGKNT